MLSAGDVQGCLRKLETLLRTIKYPGNVDYNSLSNGDPSAFLPIVSFTLTSFSPPFAKQLIDAGLELTGKNDLRFTDTVYKVLRDIFHYKPVLTKQQFLQWGFSQRKISVICDIINLVLQKHNQLKKPRVRCPVAHKDDRGDVRPTLTDADTVSARPFVVNHMGNSSTFPIIPSHVEVFSCTDVTETTHGDVDSKPPGNEILELPGQEEGGDYVCKVSEVEGRLEALEARLEGLARGLDRLSVLEKRLEEFDGWRNTEPKVDGTFQQDEAEVITISRRSWENLLSRVQLLETRLELSNMQSSAPPPCPSSSSSYSTMSEASKDDLKDRLERIATMCTRKSGFPSSKSELSTEKLDVSHNSREDI